MFAAMPFRCPECACESPLAEADVGADGRMVRCVACGTHWLARRFDDDPYRYPALQRIELGAERFADAVVVEHISPSFMRKPPHRREPPARSAKRLDGRIVKGLGTLLVTLVGVVALRAPIVAALPQLPGALPLAVADLQFQRVRSETVRLHGDSTLFVEGEIVNTSGGDVALPAIRITLRSQEGAPVKSWLVEPAVAGLAAGRSVGFRSALASPPDEATQVTLNLAVREGT
jgi:predicted Zn finger-like uncharacterized protein